MPIFQLVREPAFWCGVFFFVFPWLLGALMFRCLRRLMPRTSAYLYSFWLWYLDLLFEVEWRVKWVGDAFREAPWSKDVAVKICGLLMAWMQVGFCINFAMYESCGPWWCDLAWEHFRGRLNGMLLLLCLTAPLGQRIDFCASSLSFILGVQGVIFTVAMNLAFYGVLGSVLCSVVLALAVIIICIWKERGGDRSM